MGPSAVALLALVLFVPIAIAIFARMPRADAAAAVALAGTLLLPERTAWDFPLIPPLDKEYITYLAIFLGAYLYRPRSITSARPGTGPEAILLLMFLANVATALANPDPMWDEGRLEPGRGVWAVVAQTGDDFLGFALPFFLGRALFTTRKDLRTLVTFIAGAGLLYTVPILIEVSMSIPFRVFQLSDWIYGVPMRPQWRWGMIQPIVFMENGLALATLMAGSLLAATALAKLGRSAFRLGPILSPAIVWFGLLMTRNVAGNLYGAALTLATLILRPRFLAHIALSLAALTCIYPAMCILRLFPSAALVEFASEFDAERARSLEGRFLEEDHVLGSIGSRVWFGWGTYERIPGAETFGRGEVGLDSYWIIRLGTNGIVGVQLHFLMLAWPVLSAWRRIRRFGNADAALLAALMAIVGMRAIDLLINGWWNYLPVFLAGSLYGLARAPSEAHAAPPASLRRRGSARRRGDAGSHRAPESRGAARGTGARAVEPDGRTRQSPGQLAPFGWLARALWMVAWDRAGSRGHLTVRKGVIHDSEASSAVPGGAAAPAGPAAPPHPADRECQCVALRGPPRRLQFSPGPL
jgi:hypothetical protein